MFGGMTIIAVDPGHQVEYKGEKMTVTEENAVTLFNKIYVTHKHAAALKSHPSVKTIKGATKV